MDCMESNQVSETFLFSLVLGRHRACLVLLVETHPTEKGRYYEYKRENIDLHATILMPSIIASYWYPGVASDRMFFVG